MQFLLEEKIAWMQEYEKIREKLKKTGYDFSRVKITCIEKAK